MGEQEVDPYNPEPPYTYECMECGYRTEADHQPQECPRCHGAMQDLSVSRE